MPKINDEYDIGKAFQAIEDELIASYIRNLRQHKIDEVDENKQWSMWQVEQLKSLEKYKKDNQEKYGKQFKDINAQIEEMIRIAKSEGNMEQEKKILDAIKKGFPAKKVSQEATAEFFKLNERKLEALIKATMDGMEKAETAVLRMADDQYRKVIFNAHVYANTGAGTYEKAVDMATKDFLAAGLNCIEYANGARHTLADYADMAVRTASKRAYLQGEGEMRHEWGVFTVIMNKRTNPCSKCLPFVGKVLIDDVWSGGPKDGKSPETGIKYPLMSSAIEAGLYHPRCKDVHTTYFEGISTPPDDKFTKEELDELVEQNRREAKQQYAKRQERKYSRLAKNSLDNENQEKYAARAREWKSTHAIYASKKVKYDPESNYEITIPEYNDEVNKGLSEAILDLVKKGDRDGYEHMHLVNLSNGNIEFYETNQEPESVGLDFWKIIKENPDTEYAFVHNHNIESSLSETDLITSAKTNNIPIVIAAQNDGVIYYAKKRVNAPKGFWPDDYFAEELKSLNEELKNGTITMAERNRLREEIIIHCMLEEFFEGMVIVNGKRK